jgi:hypothetical protein
LGPSACAHASNARGGSEQIALTPERASGRRRMQANCSEESLPRTSVPAGFLTWVAVRNLQSTATTIIESTSNQCCKQHLRMAVSA